MKKHVKTLLGITVLAGTVIVFAWYLRSHPEVLRQLKHLKITTLLVLLAIYAVWWAALAGVLQATMRLFNKKMTLRENVMLSAYSSLLNFFGPGQSGPGLRGLYLKKKHGLAIKKYIFGTLLYYAFYSIISAGMLCAGSQAWWKTMLGIAAAAAGSALVLRWYAKKARSQLSSGSRMELPVLGWLFVATAIQMIAQFAIYFVEITAIDPSASVGQTLTYTGTANFALFVALTPGAIGIRESFLLFTQQLHHLSSTIIVTANVIDRAVYLILLGVLFAIVLALHAGKKLKLRQLAAEAEQNSEKSEADSL